MANPIRAPTGTARIKAVSTSLAVTARSLRTLARCNSSQSMTSVSEAEGNRRGLTAPVRDRISHAANNATTTATRAAFIANVPAIVSASESGRNRLVMGRETFLRRRKILHAAEFGELERQLKLLQRIGSAHAAVGFQLHDRIIVFQS